VGIFFFSVLTLELPPCAFASADYAVVLSFALVVELCKPGKQLLRIDSNRHVFTSQARGQPGQPTGQPVDRVSYSYLRKVPFTLL
jgi:hypothetical protein